ncbi:MAG: hypothetical protein RIC38_06320, partial [Chromatocurvus sp.]
MTIGLLMTSAVTLAQPEKVPAEKAAEPAAMQCGQRSARTISYEDILAEYADTDSKFATLEGLDGIRT